MTVKTADEILENILEYLKTQFDLDYIPEGGVLYGIAQAIALELQRNHRNLQELASNAYLSTASGVFLDALANSLGITRSEERTPGYVGGIEIYTIDGNPLIDKGLDIDWITNNTLLALDEQGNTLELVIDDNVFAQILDNFSDWKTGADPIYLNTNSIFVYGKPTTIVSDIIPKNTLNILKPELAGVAIRNITDIILVYQPETDEELRFKMFAAMTQSAPNSFAKLSAVLDTLPYIASYKLIPFARGVGTADILIIPTDLTATEGAVAAAYEDLQPVMPEGLDIRILPPTLAQVSLLGTVYYTDLMENEILDKIKTTLTDYLAGLPLGSTITTDGIKNALRSIPEIVNMQNIMFSVSVKLPTSSDSYYVGVFTEYMCKEYEKPMLYPNEDEAIKFDLRSV